MIALHETTRKRMCRTAFLALCLTPTLATAAWIVDHRLPWRPAAIASALSDRCRCDVQLNGWSEPRPNMIRAAGVTLTAVAAGLAPVELKGFESRRRDDALILTIDQITLSVADLPALAAHFHQALSRADVNAVDLHIDKVVLRCVGDQSITLDDLHGSLHCDAAGLLRLRLCSRLAERSDPTVVSVDEPVCLTVETVADAPGRRQVVTLDARRRSVPASLLAPLVPGVVALNESALFSGSAVWHVERTSTLQGALQGWFAGVDLAVMLPADSPHRLRGAVDVELTDCRWQGERFERLTGAVSGKNVETNGSLLYAAQKYLGCQLGPQLVSLQTAGNRGDGNGLPGQLTEIHRADRFACRFDLDAHGIVLHADAGADSPLPPTCLASINDQPLLLEPPFIRSGTKLPAAAWVQFIASPPASWIPFTPAALETARRLPTPQ